MSKEKSEKEKTRKLSWTYYTAFHTLFARVINAEAIYSTSAETESKYKFVICGNIE